jgi:Protein of unknown function (DUF3313)
MRISVVKAQRSSHLAVAWLWMVAVLAGCTTTQQVKVADNPQGYCPFLGPDLCAKLTPGTIPGRFSTAAVSGRGDTVMGLRYVNPNVRWTEYKKVIIAPVSFWAGDDTTLSKTDQRALTDYFFKALNDALSQKFQVVDQPGPGVMDIEVAIDEIGKAVPVLRTVSMVVPQARALVTLKYAATGTYAFIGSAQAEGKVIDSVTGQVLVAGVDKRVGGGSITTAVQWQLGDAENAITAWCKQTADRLSSWTSGTPAS